MCQGSLNLEWPRVLALDLVRVVRVHRTQQDCEFAGCAVLQRAGQPGCLRAQVVSLLQHLIEHALGGQKRLHVLDVIEQFYRHRLRYLIGF